MAVVIFHSSRGRRVNSSSDKATFIFPFRRHDFWRRRPVIHYFSGWCVLLYHCSLIVVYEAVVAEVNESAEETTASTMQRTTFYV